MKLINVKDVIDVNSNLIYFVKAALTKPVNQLARAV